jgi:aspartate/methionine/tyrosine aminotransferase
MHYPALLKDPRTAELFPADAIERARSYLSNISGGTGAYTTSQGVKAIRSEVAAFLKERDGGVGAREEDLFLTDGASAGVKMVLNLIVRSKADGVMTPIPQYPLYSASMSLFGGEGVGYYLDESKGWGLTKAELERSYQAGLAKGVQPRALVVINPGNPTGQCLSRDSMVEILQFCAEHNLLLMADEVYQTNVYAATPFNSFKRVAVEEKSPVSLVSFHSVSKGFLGECGQRGGFMELHQVGEDFRAQVIKLASISLCSNTSGQIVTGLMVNPPKPGAPSHALYEKERDTILASLKRRATKLSATLNECTGVRSNTVEGAMYAFPSITLPAKAVEAAKAAGKVPDVFYCLALLDATGICVVPGSGFGQREGTWHFRTTILPSEEAMEGVMQRFRKFHEEFMQKYA